jgi:hypothetical protein
VKAKGCPEEHALRRQSLLPQIANVGDLHLLGLVSGGTPGGFRSLESRAAHVVATSTAASPATRRIFLIERIPGLGWLRENHSG